MFCVYSRLCCISHSKRTLRPSEIVVWRRATSLWVDTIFSNYPLESSQYFTLVVLKREEHFAP